MVMRKLASHRTRFLVLGPLFIAFMTTGCAHTLEIKNLDLYKPTFMSSQPSNLSVGLSASTSTPEEERLVISIVNSLKRDGLNVTYPFYLRDENKTSVDYFINLHTGSSFEGSGWNFLINWPGFLIWTPAWHGYNYRARFTFDADLTETASETKLTRISAPVELDIRHADMNRTWTELSWLEWSAIAFVGGIIFTRYDTSVTPRLIDATENKIGDYVASKLSGAMMAAQQSTTSGTTPQSIKGQVFYAGVEIVGDSQMVDRVKGSLATLEFKSAEVFKLIQDRIGKIQESKRDWCDADRLPATLEVTEQTLGRSSTWVAGYIARAACYTNAVQTHQKDPSKACTGYQKKVLQDLTAPQEEIDSLQWST